MNPQVPTVRQHTAAHDLKARLLGRAVTDPTFRQRLLTDPKGAIEQELGVTLPADLRIEVVEETPNRLYLVLPAQSPTGNQLSDAELSKMVGGLWAYLPGSVYTVNTDQAGRTVVTFGDGAEGAKLPTGSTEISASYRTRP